MNLQKLFFASAVLVAMSGSAYSQTDQKQLPELDNCWYQPVGNPTGFEFDFVGNATGTIPAQVTNDSTVNAFFGQHLANPSFNYNPTTVVFDGGANLTRVTLSGDALPNPRSTNNPNPNHLGANHFGLNGGWQSTVPTLASVEWLYPSSTFALPALQVSWNGVLGKRRNAWAAIYIETKEGPSGCWHFMPYPLNVTTVNVAVANRSAAPATIHSIGYRLGFAGSTDRKCRKSPQCKGNEEALDELNDTDFPIPGAEGSQFIIVKPPKKPLQPGDTFVFKAK